MAHKVAILGSGNWGSSIACVLGNNVRKLSTFANEVRMWVYEERVDGKKLTDIINTKHENVRYLPGVRMPENVVAVPDELETVRDATLLVFVVPHQFVQGLCRKIRGHIHPRARAVSLIKGLSLDEDKRPVLISDLISRELGGFDVSVLSGANIASEVVHGPLSEATLGYHRRAAGRVWRQLFHCPLYRINISPDVAGIEVSGALKNVVAVAAGLCDGLQYGANTRVAIMRIGFREMMQFAQAFFANVSTETFFESCGVGDLIVTCYSGRNARVAKEFAATRKPFAQLEAEMLNGQKLQGTLTAKEVYEVLEPRDMLEDFPLFHAVYRICWEGADPASIAELDFSLDAPLSMHPISASRL